MSLPVSVQLKLLIYVLVLFSIIWTSLGAGMPIGGDAPFIRFSKGNLDQVLNIGQQSNKYTFVNTTSRQCGLCPKVSNLLFTDQEVSQFFNHYFVNYNLNLDAHENVNIANILGLGWHPTMFFFNTEGQIVKKVVGVDEPNDLIAEAKRVLQRRYHSDSDFDNLLTYDMKYTHGLRDPAFLREYAYMLRDFNRPYNAIVNDYLRTQTPQKLRSKHNRSFIFDFITNLENNAIDHFLLDIEHFKKIIRGQVINERIKVAIFNSIRTATIHNDQRLFNRTLYIIKKANLPDKEQFLFFIQAAFAEGTLNRDLYYKNALHYLNQYNITNPQILNQVAFKFLMFNDRNRLRQALKWVEKSTRLQPSYESFMTQAHLLYKLKDCKSALAALENAKLQAQLNNLPLEELRRLRDLILSRGC